jgi:hypothetical protein
MMNQGLTIKVVAGVVLIIAGAGSVVFVSHHGRGSGEPQVFESVPPAPVIHTAAWYVAHPDVLKQDEARCAGDAATIPQAACQNADSADSTISEMQMENAAAQNGAASSGGTSKTP